LPLHEFKAHPNEEQTAHLQTALLHDQHADPDTNHAAGLHSFFGFFSQANVIACGDAGVDPLLRKQWDGRSHLPRHRCAKVEVSTTTQLPGASIPLLTQKVPNSPIG